MRRAKSMLLAVGVAIAQFGVVSVAQGQSFSHDCGNKCKTCGLGGKEGYEHGASGIYDMGCFDLIPNCVSCVVERVNDGHDIEMVFDRLRAGSEFAVRHFASSFKGRLRVNASRNLVVLLGTKCDPNAIAGVASITPSRASLLLRSGVPLLRQSLQESGAK